MSGLGRRLLVGGGVVALALGVAASFAPEVPDIGPGRAVVTFVGAVALFQALRIASDRLDQAVEADDTPVPERPTAVPSPGDDLAQTVAQFADTRQLHLRDDRLRGALRAAARTVLTHHAGLTEEEADERLDSGTWTDDPEAAAFFRRQADGTAASARDRVSAAFGRTASFERRIGRAVDAVAAVAGVTGDGASDPVDRDGSPDGDPTAEREPVPTGVVRPTNRWFGVGAVALACVGAGVVFRRPAVVLAGVVGVGFAAYARSGTAPQPVLAVDRTVAPTDPDPGDTVDVSVTVRNEGDRTLPDLRLLDGVPDALAVAEGSPRRGAVLRPGESVTFDYGVRARRGVHEFQPLLAISRDLAGSTERREVVETPATLTCRPQIRATAVPLALRPQAARYTGQVRTNEGGEGLEFHATRQYRPGDPINRIDWNRRARTGDLATLEFRIERAATVMLVIDARETSYLAPDRTGPHAVDRAVEAAGRLLAGLTERDNATGVAAVGVPSCWLAPKTGPSHRIEARDLLATHPAVGATPDGRSRNTLRWKQQLYRRLDDGVQVVFLSPLCDDYAPRLARQLDAAGHPVTVVSPDPTTTDTPGRRLAHVARSLRLSDLRRGGIPVVDWSWGESLESALARSREWSP